MKKKGQTEAALQELCNAVTESYMRRDMDCPDPVYVSDNLSTTSLSIATIEPGLILYRH